VLLARTNISLTRSEQQCLHDTLEHEVPDLLHRLQQPYAVDRLEQPWFRRHNILDVQFLSEPAPARLYLAVAIGAVSDDDVAMSVLTGELQHLIDLATLDPPQCLDNEALAAAYAAYGNEWTRGRRFGEMMIASFDDLPWSFPLSHADEQRVDALRARFGRQLYAQRRSHTTAGWCFQAWWLSARSLIERELVVPITGALTRKDVVHVTELPVPLGEVWDVVDGRLVPIS
jgi:hypothetical protein